MSRWRPLRIALVVAIIVVAAEAGARMVVARVPDEIRSYDASAQLKLDELERRGGADLIVLGTSMAEQALVPDALVDAGVADSAYNLALPGGVPQVMERWVVDGILPVAVPEAVVWGLGPLDFTTTYGAENFAAVASAPDLREGVLAGIDRWFSERSALIRHRRLLRDPSALFGDEADERRRDLAEAERYTAPDGARTDFRPRLDDELRTIQRGRLAGTGTDPADVVALARTVDRLQRAGASVYFVELPTPPRLLPLLPAGRASLDAVHDQIQRVGAALGVPVVDEYADLLADPDFVDFTHVNQASAERISRLVAGHLDPVGTGAS